MIFSIVNSGNCHWICTMVCGSCLSLFLHMNSNTWIQKKIVVSRPKTWNCCPGILVVVVIFLLKNKSQSIVSLKFRFILVLAKKEIIVFLKIMLKTFCDVKKPKRRNRKYDTKINCCVLLCVNQFNAETRLSYFSNLHLLISFYVQ